MTPNHRRDESWMGRYARARKSRVTLHSIVNRLFAVPKKIPARIAALPREEFSDVSFYQGVINWLIMRSKAAKVIIRAGQNIWVDIRFVTNYLLARQAGMLRGIYWFFDGRASPGAQAALLVSLIKDDLPELSIWIDWERSYGGAHEGLRNVVAMMQEVERLLPGVEVGIYTGFYFFIENSNPITHRAQYAYLKTKKLWLAFYAKLYDVRIPSLWPHMTYWQKGTPAVGKEWGVETIEIDINEDMAGGVIPEPEPTPGGTMDTFRVVWSDGCNRRPQPNVNNTPVPPAIEFGANVSVVEYFTPAGKTAAQERWGKMPDNLWIALVHNSQVRASLIVSPDPGPVPVPGLPEMVIEIAAGMVTVSGPSIQTVSIELRPK